jgi:hypothetical protein
MPSTVFVDGSTVIDAVWLNEVDTAVNVNLSTYLASISDIKNVRLPAIEADGWIINVRVTDISWSKVISRPTTMAGYGITDRPTLLNVRVFTTAQSGSTYVPTAGTARIYVEMVGGGGSGGRAIGDGNPNNVVCASGGSAGTWASGLFTSGLTGHVITVGAGGVCLSSGGVAGGTTSLGTLLGCPGGAGGLDGLAWNYISGNISGPSPYPTAFTGVPTGTPLLTVVGNPGDTPTSYHRSGGGASSPFGQGGAYYVSRAAPSEISAPPQNFGSGGAGNANSGGFTDTMLGGNGAPGFIIIWEYNS